MTNQTMLTIQALAGYCPEEALWKLILDISTTLLDNPPQGLNGLTPQMIALDGEDFRLAPAQATMTVFCPPEGDTTRGETAWVWAIGAIVCYASSGHYIFGGRGGAYQREHPKVALPVLRKEHEALTPLVQQCLCYTPAERIKLKELREKAAQGLQDCMQQTRRKKEPAKDTSPLHLPTSDESWPEAMTAH